MQLLVFSHRLEAKFFLMEYPYKPAPTMPDYFYLSKDKAILIAGEHPLQVAIRVSRALTSLANNCRQVYHLGLAVILCEDSSLKKPISEIRVCYGAQGKKPWQKSFSLSIPHGSDLISTAHRLPTLRECHFWGRFAHLADRESYAIAMACEEFGNLPLRIAKYLLPKPSQLEDCRKVKAQAEDIAYALYQYYSQNFIISPATLYPQEIAIPEGFYLTHSMRQQYQQLLTALQNKYQLSLTEIFAKVKVEQICQQKITAKEKGLKLIETLHFLLNPHLYQMRQEYEANLSVLRKAGWQVDAAQSLEQGILILSGKITNQQEREAMARALLAYQDNKNGI